MRNRPNQLGSALVLALLVAAVVAGIASSVLWRLEIWIGDVESQRETAMLRTLARGGVDWARAVLEADARAGATDHAGEPWNQRVVAFRVEDGEISGHLDEQQGKWNLNNLVKNGKVDAFQFEVFQRLLDRIGLPTQLAYFVRDWIDADRDAADDGAEDAYYLSLPVPYLAANAPLTSIDELRSVRGFSPEVIAALYPFATALPEFTPVNVNLAPREVLAALQPGFTDGDIDAILARRDSSPFRDLSDFRGTLRHAMMISEENTLTTVSSYFLANVTARHENSSIELMSMIRRVAGRTEILWQRYR